MKKILKQEIGKRFRTHGMSQTRFYHIWENIKQRTGDKNSSSYEKYGGRGIKCLWKSFEEFKDDMYDTYLSHVKELGERETSINRIDNNSHYCRENCEWAILSIQATNRRNTRIVRYKNKDIPISILAKQFGLKYSTLLARIDVYQWPIEKALIMV